MIDLQVEIEQVGYTAVRLGNRSGSSKFGPNLDNYLQLQEQIPSLGKSRYIASNATRPQPHFLE